MNLKKENISYSIGVFPSLELLKNKAEFADRVYISSKLNLKSEGFLKIKALTSKHKIEIIESDKTIKRVSKKENEFLITQFKGYKSQISKEDSHVVLVNPENSGNLGTICRTMLGLGFFNLAIIKPGVDVLCKEVVRASMGAIFSLNFEYFENLENYFKSFESHKKYFFVTKSQNILESIKFETHFSLIFGSESSGLNQDDLSRFNGKKVQLRQSKRIDSFNLAIAAGISIYAASSFLEPAPLDKT